MRRFILCLGGMREHMFFTGCERGIVLDGLSQVFSEIERLSQECGTQITPQYIDALEVAMRERGASDLFIQVLRHGMEGYG